jgi:methyltransferase (TIGR00027 family)
MSYTLGVERISDTAFITATARARETERPDAHFRDPNARLLAGDRGEELLRSLPGSEWTEASCVIRTCLLDELLLRTLTENRIDTVLNLGAGLDARPFRLPLEHTLRWIEVDCQNVLDFKASKLSGYPQSCAMESIPLDVTNNEAMHTTLHRIGSQAKQALVITEGLLTYLTAEQVSALALELSAQAGFRWWLTDLISPVALWLMSKVLGRSPEARDVTLRFAPEDAALFFHQHGWATEESRSCLEEGRRLDRWFIDKSVLVTLSNAQLEVMQKLFLVVRLGRAN